jgi:hypothetical protein
VTCQPAGITSANIDAFLTEGGELDMLVEECDSVDIKIILRQKAKAHRIPVLMDTSDRGMLDIERFDLEPDRPILHGLIAHLDPAAAAEAKTNEEKIPFLAPMAGMDQLSPRMKASMVEVGQTITTWPQLATGVILGGALVGDAYRRIMAGELHGSGRWYVDLEQLISDPHRYKGDPTTSPQEVQVTERTTGPIEERPIDASVSSFGRPVPRDIAIKMAEAGRLAPSADNMQPWKFLHQNGRLLLFHDRSRSHSVLDSEEMIPHVALGMCLENMLLAGDALRVPLAWKLFPLASDPTLIAVIGGADQSLRGTDMDRALAVWIEARHTDRKHGDRSPLPPDAEVDLRAAISTIPGARMHFLTDRDRIDEVAVVCGRADRLRIMNEHGHDEFFHKQLRWTHDEAIRTGDGLDIETLELTATERVGLRMAASPVAMRALRGVGGGRALEKISTNAVRSASAIALLTMSAITPEGCVEGGRASQRLWLKATELGFAVHPLSAPIFLAGPAARPSDASLTPGERAEMNGLAHRLRELFGSPDGSPVFMVRLSRAPAPSARSVRRSLEHVLNID